MKKRVTEISSNDQLIEILLNNVTDLCIILSGDKYKPE